MAPSCRGTRPRWRSSNLRADPSPVPTLFDPVSARSFRSVPTRFHTKRLRKILPAVRKFISRTSTLPAGRNPSTRTLSSPKVRRVSGREGSLARSKRFCASPALISRRLRSNRSFRCGAPISLGDTHRGPERYRKRRRDAKRCGLRHQKHLRVPIAGRAITKDLVPSSRPRSLRLTVAFVASFMIRRRWSASCDSLSPGWSQVFKPI